MRRRSPPEVSPTPAGAAAGRGLQASRARRPGVLLAVLLQCVMLLALAPQAGARTLPWGCGELSNGETGPYDYRDTSPRVRHVLSLVEKAHFTPVVFNLKGAGPRHMDSPPGGGINYTLRAFPNHYGALDALGRLAIRDQSTKPAGLYWSVECYFLRAMAFAPDDGQVHSIYATYLFRSGNLEKAEEEYRIALEMLPDSAETHYNYGLLLSRLGRYAEAYTHAVEAYSRGYPLPGLRKILMKKGHWKPLADRAPAGPGQATHPGS